ncbi:TPM domain-containing protein [Membranihabitans marinus]|uniref:TPM domain-containing protein n=1 Tax=Membranihabitans marinus TaxID=1227546 RepID=UPI001F346FEC|nr:TPM domain-containing protein [Membranihabitans marinus]
MKNPLLSSYFNKEEKKDIVDAIRKAEKNTSGEIRVYFEKSTKGQPVLDRALKAFRKLKMDQTELKNGILFYIAFHDHQCAIIGDSGIHSIVGDEFWEKELKIMQTHFKEDQYVLGLTKAIILAGDRLAEYFPWQKDDINELSDDIYFEEDEK